MDGPLESRLRSFRQRAGMTLGGLAARSRVSKATLSRWESGLHRPRTVELGSVLNALGVSDRERKAALALLGTPEANRLLRLEADPPPLTGDLIRALRLRRGLTQAEAARLVGATQSALARWEGGQNEPDASTRHALAFALGALPEEATALVAGRFEMGDGEEWTPERHLEHLNNIRVLFRHHPLRELRVLGAGVRAWQRFLETGDRAYVEVYGYALAFQALTHAEEGDVARASMELQAHGRLPKPQGFCAHPDVYPSYAKSLILRARGKKGASLAALADDPTKPEDVRAWFASERATIIEGADPDRGVRLARQAFERARAAHREDPGRNIDVFYRSHSLGAALARHGRLDEALDVLAEGGALYGGLTALLAHTNPDIAAYSVQHLLRLAEAHLDAGDRQAAEAHLTTTRARIATMPHLQGHGRAFRRLEDRLGREGLRVRA